MANALQVLKQERILTQRDIQEERYNRDVEDWRREVEEDIAFEKRVGIYPHEDYQQESTSIE